MITTRQDIANGRTDKAEAAIEAVKKEVGQILTEGCDQKHKHASDVALLRGSGAVLPYEETPLVRDPIPYMGTPDTRKKLAKRAGIGGGLVGVGVLLPHVVTGVHWVLDHFTLVK
jgi:hypothetical protein